MIVKGDQAYVVLVKKILGIPVPGKTYYYMNHQGLASRSVPVWVPLVEGNRTYATAKAYHQELQIKEQQNKTVREKKVAIEEKI